MRKNCTVLGVKLNSVCSLSISLECSMVSYAFDRFTYTAIVGLGILVSEGLVLE